MNRALLLALFLLPTAASAAISHAGYFGLTLRLERAPTGECVVDASRFAAQRDQGTSPTFATALGNQDGDLYLLADCAGPLSEFAAANGTQLLLDLTGILFDPATQHDLRPDYQLVMQAFHERAEASAALHLGNGFSASNVVTAVIHAEAGNSPASRADVNRAVEEWDRYYPLIPTTAGYPVSNASSPLPPAFPWRLDYIATWDYDTFAPLEPDNGANRGVPTFYDPAAPTSAGTKWGNFLSRLQPHQKVFLLIAGWYGCWQKDNGWARWQMKYVARGFCRFARARPEVVAVTLWLWESYPAEPSTVQCRTGTVAYGLEGTAQLAGTGILPFHDAIFDLAAGTGTDCP